MGDPFNFEVLQQHTPKYLELSSLKEALLADQEQGSEELTNYPQLDFVRQGMADVSMEDQEIAESDPELEIETDAKANAEEPDLAMVAPEPAPEPSPSHKVLSPTQFGAHWALDSPDQRTSNKYNYEIRMPIPAPWHENLPYMLSTYLQLLFNFGIGLVACWLVLVAKRDVSAVIRERSEEIALQASWCQQQYVINKCTPDQVDPHLHESQFCLDLERCIDRDPANVRWLSVHASLLSEVLNELIEPLTVRTMVSLAALASTIGITIFMVNYLFGFLRARTYYQEGTEAAHRSVPRGEMHISAKLHNNNDQNVQ